MVVDGLEYALSRLAEQVGLPDQQTHSLTPASPAQERRADRVIVSVTSELRKPDPQCCPMLLKGLKGGLALCRWSPIPAEGSPAKLQELAGRRRRSLIDGARPPRDRQR